MIFFAWINEREAQKWWDGVPTINFIEIKYLRKFLLTEEEALLSIDELKRKYPL